MVDAADLKADMSDPRRQQQDLLLNKIAELWLKRGVVFPQ